MKRERLVVGYKHKNGKTRAARWGSDRQTRQIGRRQSKKPNEKTWSCTNEYNVTIERASDGNKPIMCSDERTCLDTYRFEQIGQAFRFGVHNHRVNIATFDVEQNLSKVVGVAFAKHKLHVFRQSRWFDQFLESNQSCTALKRSKKAFWLDKCKFRKVHKNRAALTHVVLVNDGHFGPV